MSRKKRKANKKAKKPAKKRSRNKPKKNIKKFTEEVKEFAKEEFPEKEEQKKKISIGSLVKLDYSLSTKEGIIVDTSIGFEADNCGILDSDREYKPIEIIVGNNETLKGIDKALVGMHENECKTFVIKAADAFGNYKKSKIKKFKLSILDFKHKPVVGESVALTDDSDAKLGIIRKVSDKEVIVDFNHPLAGKDLICSIKVLKVYE